MSDRLIRSTRSYGSENDRKIDQNALVPGKDIDVMKRASGHCDNGKCNRQGGANQPTKDASPVFCVRELNFQLRFQQVYGDLNTGYQLTLIDANPKASD